MRKSLRCGTRAAPGADAKKKEWWNMNRNQKGNIVIYGAEEATDVLEGLCRGCGYGVVRVRRKSDLRDAADAEETKLLLFGFGKEEAGEPASLSLLAQLRQACLKPIVAMVDREREMLRVLALNAGADDILDDAVSPMECLARIQAKVRCYRRFSEESEKSRSIRMRELEMDDSAKLVLVKGNRVNLTPTEYKILRLLMEQPGKVLSNKEIYEAIWKMAPIGADNTIAVHVRHIREKIEENPQEPRYLQVVWGQGYKVG